MTIHYNRESEKVNRKKLRKNSTEAEKVLWEYLKNRRFLGLKFKRQYSIDHFVIDFFCPKLKFAIELDGGIHLNKDVKNHDENRDAFLKDFGIEIIRLRNQIVLKDIEKTLKIIESTIITLTQTSPKSSP